MKNVLEAATDCNSPAHSQLSKMDQFNFIFKEIDNNIESESQNTNRQVRKKLLRM